MHVGLIGGIGPAATDYYYRRLIARHTEAGIPMELTIAHAEVREMTKNLASGNAAGQAQIFARLVQQLAAAGAKAAAVTSMGGHFCREELAAISVLPTVNAVPAVDAALKDSKIGVVGIIGTRTVMQSGLYGGITSARVVVPQGAELDDVHNSYVEMAVAGRVTEAQRRTFFAAGQRLCREQGADAVMLGGTDLCLAFEGQECGFPVVDCADIHAGAIFQLSSRAA
jgi:aspartate racemase